ncbi:hypothetical protein RXV94_09680 [Yeosuana sp. MJ-SS3]|uniref:Cytochrome c domain-containing protein n=1 Tax=Gilvirhabdus luticola TaxID=3079858 RepID=A0ABU3U7P4_9FLAO|nr:hypothetical protein [Yeosuana sp. MJ-SS3]MDU8886429.1 hypothetical protein [Yeosuana sp. MJ-SS3]
MKKYLIFSASIITIFSIISCTNHSENDLLEPVPPDPDPELVTYIDDVKVIIDNNCIFCHNNPPVNGAPNSLTTYDKVKSAVENSNLINRISAQPGEAGFMPFGGTRLPQNLIDKIVQWETDGLLEN